MLNFVYIYNVCLSLCTVICAFSVKPKISVMSISKSRKAPRTPFERLALAKRVFFG